MEACEDACERDHARPGEEERAHPSANESDHEGDPEGGNGMVAWEGRLVRRRDKKNRLVRMRDVWARALPKMGDDLADEEAHGGGRHPCERGNLPAVPRARAVEEPKADCRRCEEGNGPSRDEIANLVLDERVPSEEIVQIVERGPVDLATVAAAGCSKAR
jgi:hypothetical protein